MTYVPAFSCLLIFYRRSVLEVARDEVVQVLTGNAGEALYDGLGALKHREGHGTHAPMAREEALTDLVLLLRTYPGHLCLVFRRGWRLKC